MSRCLRYQNPVIYRHLAAQYVAGAITPHVRSRIEVLVKTVPELEREIAQCADDFSAIHEYFPVENIPSNLKEDIWFSIEKQLPVSLVEASEEKGLSWWNALLPWKISSGFMAVATLVMAVMLWTNTTVDQQGIAGPAYLANMSAHNESDNIQFVVSAYPKQEDQPSRLHIQWTKTHAGTHKEKLHLWAEDRETKVISYIGVQPPKGQSWDLTKPEWKAITNSHRLLATNSKQVPEEDNIIFSGLCLQLKAWKKT